MLERVLPELRNPTVVLYGFYDRHEDRNVAAATWLRKLSMYSRRGHVFVPFVSLSPEGHLIRHAPEAYPVFPLREYSSLVTLAESASAKLKAKARTADKREVTEQLLLQMRGLTRKYGAEFVLVFLTVNEETKEHYQSFLANNRIPALDCSHQLSADTTVQGEGHPNEKMNSIWAACIANSPPLYHIEHRASGLDLGADTSPQ